tara:strand:+ start:3066 stop:3185 length:120 start_codon:yes stop_codon:yes gene_type:complete
MAARANPVFLLILPDTVPANRLSQGSQFSGSNMKGNDNV